MRTLHFLRILGISILAWSVICLTGAASSYGALLQRGAKPSYPELLGEWIAAHALMVLFSALLYLALERWPQALASARGIVRTYLMVLFLFLPVECLFVSLLQERSLFAIFLELTWTTFTFVTVAGIRIWQLQRAREMDNLTLRLELERAVPELGVVVHRRPAELFVQPHAEQVDRLVPEPQPSADRGRAIGGPGVRLLAQKVEQLLSTLPVEVLLELPH